MHIFSDGDSAEWSSAASAPWAALLLSFCVELVILCGAGDSVSSLLFSVGLVIRCGGAFASAASCVTARAHPFIPDLFAVTALWAVCTFTEASACWCGCLDRRWEPPWYQAASMAGHAAECLACCVMQWTFENATKIVGACTNAVPP
eukprot:365986-Chlamydomonas_euryale.AAC.2